MCLDADDRFGGFRQRFYLRPIWQCPLDFSRSKKTIKPMTFPFSVINNRIARHDMSLIHHPRSTF